MVAAAPTKTVGYDAREPLERLLAAAGVENVEFVEAGSRADRSRAYRLLTDGNCEVVVSRLISATGRSGRTINRMFNVIEVTEDVVGDPGFELLDALAARYSARGKGALASDSAVDEGIRAAETASQAFAEEFERHAAALARIADEMRSCFRSMVEMPFPSASDSQTALRQAADRTALRPYSKRGPVVGAKSAAVRKQKPRRGKR